MSLYEAKNYKIYVKNWIASQPHGGRGLLRKLALHLRVSSVIVSQVFSGNRDLTIEQAYEACEFLGLGTTERHYFLLLVQRERAGSQTLKNYYEKQIEELQRKSREIKNRVQTNQRVSSENSAIFYSRWIYSAIRLATSVPSLQTIPSLAEYFKLPKSEVQNAVEFLLSAGLLSETSGRLKMGPRATHLPSNSPSIRMLHTNWRVRALEKMDRKAEEELFFTSPVSLSKRDQTEFQKELLGLIERFSKRVKDSPEETLACLNIDWFTF